MTKQDRFIMTTTLMELFKYESLFLCERKDLLLEK